MSQCINWGPIVDSFIRSLLFMQVEQILEQISIKSSFTHTKKCAPVYMHTRLSVFRESAHADKLYVWPQNATKVKVFQVRPSWVGYGVCSIRPALGKERSSWSKVRLGIVWVFACSRKKRQKRRGNASAASFHASRANFRGNQHARVIYLSSNLILGRAGTETKRERTCKSTRAGLGPKHISRLINKKAVRWNEEEIKKEAKAESASLIFCSSETLPTQSCSEHCCLHPFPQPWAVNEMEARHQLVSTVLPSQSQEACRAGIIFCIRFWCT